MTNIVINPSQTGTGQFSIDAPVSNNNRSFTLPDATTTLVGTDAVQTLSNKTLTQASVNAAPIAPVEGTAPIFACRAWVNFDGTRNAAGATDATNTNRLIRGSGNVTSVLRNGTGDYTVNFTTAMPDANYSLAATAGDGTAVLSTVVSYANTSVRIRVANSTNGGVTDVSFLNLTIFR